MTLNTTGDETPNNNTRTSDEDNNDSRNNNKNTKNGTKKKKKKKKANGGGGSHDEAGKKFEGLSKEEAFKGVILECGKAAIQARTMREACITHANGQK